MRDLGLPLFSKRLSSQGCAPLLDKIRRRLSSWKANLLSLAGTYQVSPLLISDLLVLSILHPDGLSLRRLRSFSKTFYVGLLLNKIAALSWAPP